MYKKIIFLLFIFLSVSINSYANDKNTGLGINEISYISPLWTYKLLTTISVLMIIGEIIAFLN